MEKIEKTKFNAYKGYPLVRKDNKLYYGNMNDEYVVEITILSSEKVKNLEVGNKIRILLQPTDPEKLDLSKIKNSVRTGLYDALETANTWLVKANAE